MIRRVVVFGGTGFVGRAFARRCATLRPDWQLRVPTRRLVRGGDLRSIPGLELIETDVLESSSLQALLDDVDVVVNLIAILHGREAEFQRLHVDLPRRIGQACRAADVSHLVHVSALGAGPDAPSMYLRSKAEGEAAVQAAGVPWTILRPSVVFGAEDHFLNLFGDLQRWLPLVAVPCTKAQFQPVWVRDLAAALQRCVDDPTTAGQTYEIAGPEVFTLRDLVRLAGRHVGHRRPVIPLPHAIGVAQAWLLEHLPGGPLMSRDNLRSMERPNVASGNLPGLVDLGLPATPIDVAWAEDAAAGQAADELQRWRGQHRGG